MGMGTALYEAIDFQHGRVLNAGFTRYRVPRSSDAPRIETLLVGDAETPSTGAGRAGHRADRGRDLERGVGPHRRAAPGAADPALSEVTHSRICRYFTMGVLLIAVGIAGIVAAAILVRTRWFHRVFGEPNPGYEVGYQVTRVAGPVVLAVWGVIILLWGVASL